jgi:hypothetical protein
MKFIDKNNYAAISKLKKKPLLITKFCFYLFTKCFQFFGFFNKKTGYTLTLVNRMCFLPPKVNYIFLAQEHLVPFLLKKRRGAAVLTLKDFFEFFFLGMI